MSITRVPRAAAAKYSAKVRFEETFGVFGHRKHMKSTLATVIFIIFFACTAGVSSLADDLCEDYKFDLEDLLALSAQWLDEFGCVDH